MTKTDCVAAIQELMDKLVTDSLGCRTPEQKKQMDIELIKILSRYDTAKKNDKTNLTVEEEIYNLKDEMWCLANDVQEIKGILNEQAVVNNLLRDLTEVFAQHLTLEGK